MQQLSRAITVGQLNNYIKQVFEAEEMLHHIEVIGEISGCKKSGNNVFFTLKDEDAQISCTMFGGKEIKDGTKVIARGTVNYWNKAGKISFIVTKCEEFGLGELMKMLQQLQDKLRREGLFDTATKKSIPSNVKRVGVITSRAGAVIHDIVTVANRRNPNIDIVLFPVQVQGIGAEQEISNAINFFNEYKNKPDILIVARGGGSYEDLQPFNTEIVARSVFASSIPIVSAVGHENDFTLIDFVADLRAGTPSIAAELCVREIVTEHDKIIRTWQNVKSTIARKIDKQNTLQKDLAEYPKRITRHFENLEKRLELLVTRIGAKNPIEILRQGFARPTGDLSQLKTGDDFEILYYNNENIEKGVATWKQSKK